MVRMSVIFLTLHCKHIKYPCYTQLLVLSHHQTQFLDYRQANILKNSAPKHFLVLKLQKYLQKLSMTSFCKIYKTVPITRRKILFFFCSCEFSLQILAKIYIKFCQCVVSFYRVRGIGKLYVKLNPLEKWNIKRLV